VKILIIGDTHGHPYAVKKALDMAMPVDMIIHAGDGWNDLDEVEGKVEIVKVTGNCDRSLKGESERLLKIDGHRIFITHGHKYNVKCSLNRLNYRALELKADIVIFGHLHKRVCEQEGKVLFINPGSAWRPRGCEPPSFVLMELNDQDAVFRFFDLAQPGC